ncbi:hypothetical protein WAK64_05985 [Bacillus spongiae]|uniref:Uncharacterized protein n=1 Tax=Bacillus spongiae TaxID=2683610 RepID=A0ABU8HBF8_9BACI
MKNIESEIVFFLLVTVLLLILFFSAAFAVIFLLKKKDNCLCFLGPFIAIGAVAIALGIIIGTIEVVDDPVLDEEVSSVPFIQNIV